MSKDLRLRDMNPTQALRYCVIVTWNLWKKPESADVLALLAIFREYIMNGYKDEGLKVPARLAAIWKECKAIIDKEAAL